ncbi:MAG: hypothetical protein Q9186_003699 [Xanthomendoza sp. 1 TL-2023]
MSFPGIPGGGSASGGGDLAGMSEQEQQMVKAVRNILALPPVSVVTDLLFVMQMQMAMDSCAGKTVAAGVVGFALGGAFGLFMSSMSYDTPLSAQGQQLTNLPLRQQLRSGFRDMGSRSYSSAKSFGVIGAMFAGSECCIETVGKPGPFRNECSNLA